MGTFLTSSILWDKPSKKKLVGWRSFLITRISNSSATWLPCMSIQPRAILSFKLAANKYSSIWKCQDNEHPTSANGYWGDVSGWWFWTSKLLSFKAEDPGTILWPRWVYLPFMCLGPLRKTSINCLDGFKTDSSEAAHMDRTSWQTVQHATACHEASNSLP